jgi:hypothetical protein
MGFLIALLLAVPGTDPARLANVRLADAADVQRIRAGSWRPSDPRNGRRSVHFVAPGTVVVDRGMEFARCRFASRPDRTGWALRVACGGAAPAPAHWTWLSDGRARTNLFEIAAPQMRDSQVELVRFDRDFGSVERQYRADFRLRSLRDLAGRWRDASWSTELVLDPKGATLGGKPAQLEAEPCLDLVAGRDALPVTCLSLTALDEPRLMLVSQGVRLFECEWDQSDDGARFDLAKGSRIFSRAPAGP